MGDFELFGIPVSLGTMIYQAVVFTVLTWLIKIFVMEKLLNVMENRKAYIEKQLVLAEQLKHEAELRKAEQETLLIEAKAEAKSIRLRSEQEARDLFERSQSEAKEIIHHAKDDARRISNSQNRHRGA